MILGVKEILCSIRLVGKTGKEIPKASKLEFSEKFLVNKFALSEAVNNTSGSLNRGGIANLPLLRRPLAIHLKSQKSGFCVVIDSFVFVAYAILAASKILLQ